MVRPFSFYPYQDYFPFLEVLLLVVPLLTLLEGELVLALELPLELDFETRDLDEGPDLELEARELLCGLTALLVDGVLTAELLLLGVELTALLLEAEL